jgi:hypothetical protein
LTMFENDEDLFVNEEKIISAEHSASGETRVLFKGGSLASVNETPQEIEALIRVGWGL